ncbi:MAG: rhomboid family intramembrane serine protease [Planctomycetota bacterium]
MGLYDRDYTQHNYSSGSHYGPSMRFGLPSMTPMVRNLLIINIVVFFAGLLIPPLGSFIYNVFAVDATSILTAIQPWRIITYQFLHDPDNMGHIIFNMIGLFFLGPTLERNWGSRKFLKFYLGCGAAGGLFYLFLAAVSPMPGQTMVGASGSILGMLAACAILFPQFVVFFLFFPVPIRFAAIILTLLYVANLLRLGPNAGGDAAHLAGMAAGAAYVFLIPWLKERKRRSQTSRWGKTPTQYRDLQAEVDRILEKIRDQGIKSLTSKEKKILEEATKRQRMRDKL